MTAQLDQATFADLYAEVQQFYAHHIWLLDEGAADEVAETFTEDVSMVSPPKVPEPIRGRAALHTGLLKVAETLAAQGVRYRRCHSMMSVAPQPGGELRVRSYVLVVRTVQGGESVVHAMCVCEDVLVRVDGELKVRERVVTRDDQR
ncbi:nuclear transport factor 2 family protein [Micromonospora sp. DT229]|uniref:nuclear transport factor 2 family protein n=1 Tax=Micromonospora sp. DT229 TaxID=3393430 RepID=UPI003CFACD81